MRPFSLLVAAVLLATSQVGLAQALPRRQDDPIAWVGTARGKVVHHHGAALVRKEIESVLAVVGIDTRISNATERKMEVGTIHNNVVHAAHAR